MPTGTKFDVCDTVVATKDLRQDGTFPDTSVPVGGILVPEGTVGEIVSIGLYLQEHIIYAVAFENGRVVGCMTRELDVPTAAPSPTGGDQS